VRRWAVACVLLLAGCSVPTPACTDIGSVSGVSVTVLAPYAARVDGLRLEVCWGGQCQQRDVVLAPGSDTGDQGCSGPRPDDTCSAPAVPNGTLVGFAELPGLPAGPITVAATPTVDGSRVPVAEATRTAETTYPNGPQCAAGGNQAAIEIDQKGIR
jgi:hypothetical protein